MFPELFTNALRRPSMRIIGASALLSTSLLAQNDARPAESHPCTLSDHIYTCDGAAFLVRLDHAATVRVETQNTDGVARSQLTKLVTQTMGKTIAPEGVAPDLIFLLIPTGVEGVNISPGEVDLGTLRIYAGGSGGARGTLVWAENFSGQQDLPWPIVVRSLISRFQKHFHSQ